MLSVIIPSHNDVYLHKTIDSILSAATGEIQIVPVLDGYIPDKPLRRDERIKPIHLKENVGMREAINIGVQGSTGQYLMRTDEHCMFADGFDTEITSSMMDNEIVTAVRYFLDPVKWERIDKAPVTYEKLIILTGNYHKLHGERWRQREKERGRPQIDETMAMQGSFWMMHRSWWEDVIGRLDSEGYGQLYQDSIEMVMKTWQAGGKLMVNKNTWFAHKDRSFNRTHNYPRSKSQASFDHGLKVWGEYYENEVRPKWGI